MAQLRIQDVARAKGVTMYRLQKDTGLALTTIRRYWYGTKDGKATGEPLDNAQLATLEKIARALGVDASELIIYNHGR